MAFISVTGKMVSPSFLLLVTVSSVSCLKCYQPNSTVDGFLSIFSSLAGGKGPASSVLADCPQNTNCLISGERGEGR